MTLCTLGTIEYCDMGYIPIFSSYSVATQVQSITVYNEMSVPPYFCCHFFSAGIARTHWTDSTEYFDPLIWGHF